jgi:hypothetical protein
VRLCVCAFVRLCVCARARLFLLPIYFFPVNVSPIETTYRRNNIFHLKPFPQCTIFFFV